MDKRVVQGGRDSPEPPVGAPSPTPPDDRPTMSGRAGWIICAAGLAVAVGLLAAGRLAPVWLRLDIFNNFIPHLLILAGACAVGLLVPRARIATAVAISLIGVIGIGLWPHYVSRAGPAPIDAADGERIIRVMSFNTRWQNGDWRAVADEIVRHNPDIVALVEFGRSKAPLLEALEAVYPHRTDCIDKPQCELAILSKFAFAETESRSRWRGPPLVKVTYGDDLGNLTVVGVHMIRPPFFAGQLQQMTVLGDLLAEEGGVQIVMGDFNATPPSEMLKRLIERSGLELASRLPSWPAHLGLPQIAIDHILVSPGLRSLGRVRIGSAAGSDHYPLIAEIAVPEPQRSAAEQPQDDAQENADQD